MYFCCMSQTHNRKKTELIWIIGYMGAGKSTIARLLTERLDARLTDSDEWIVRNSGKTISELFETEGETVFREWEQRCAEQIISALAKKHVVACGGGMPCYNDLIDTMLAHGTVVYLHVSSEILAERLFAEPAERPLLKGLDREMLEKDIRQRLAERIPVYERADLTIRTDAKTPETIVNEIMKNLP
jgi:shikimate kinase